MNGCPFCENLEKRNYVHWENALFWAMFDFHPVSPGHILIIPKRHIVSLVDLTKEEWEVLQQTIKDVISFVEHANIEEVYKKIHELHYSTTADWFIQKALQHTRVNTKPDAYNYGVNDGRAAGRTVDHFHLHIIPRYEGDLEYPEGGIRHVIPELGNYKRITI